MINIDPLAEARQCSDIYIATRLARDERCPWTKRGEPKKKHTGDPYQMNLAVINAKRDMDNVIAANRRMLVLIPGEKT